MEHLRESCKRLSVALKKTAEMVRPGITTGELNDFFHGLVIEGGDTPAFLNYKPFGASYPYPASICISVNDEVVHGIPRDKAFKKGDVVSFDFGITYGGMITDAAFTMVIGEVPSGDKKRLLEATEASLYAGLEEVEAGDPIGDISSAIGEVLASAKLSTFKELVGHGVGHDIHEQPDIPNYGRGGAGPILKRNMSVAVEPMACLGRPEIKTDSDGWTIRTVDGSLAAHFEHTVLVTDDGCEILTKL